MGCEVRIVICAEAHSDPRDAARAAFDRIAALERVLSDWNPDSEASHLAIAAIDGGGPFAMSDDLRQALVCAISMAHQTEGRFDPTVGPLTKLWRLARSGERTVTQADIATARRSIGHVAIEIDDRGITMAQPGMQLDFGGIGKGLAADAALSVLVARGFPASLVELGGDLVVGDMPPDGRGWRIEMDALGATVILPAWSALATSGDRIQAIDFEGARHSHVIDPVAGFGVQGAPEVSVLVEGHKATGPEDCGASKACGPGAMADALATALSVATASERAELLDRFERTSCLLVTPSGVERLRSFPLATDPGSQSRPARDR